MRHQRILLLASLFAVLAAGIGGAIWWRQHVLDERALASRDRGLEAFHAGDRVTTLDQLGRYLQRFGTDDDAEALYAYANARSELSLPNRKHIQQAIAHLRQALAVDPGHKEAQHKLLQLYLTAGYAEESRKLAGEILKRDPEDATALRAKILLSIEFQEFESALAECARLAEIAPNDIENHLRALFVMERLDRDAEAILEYPRTLPDFDPESATSQLLLAAAYDLTGDVDEALTWAERSAANATADPELIIALTAYFDRLERFETSLALLERTAHAAEDIQLTRSYVTRLFNSGQADKVIEQTDVPVGEQDTVLLAVRAMVLGGRNDADGVTAIVDELESRRNDSLAMAWAPVLTALWLEKSSADDLVAVCKEAIRREPTSPYFHYFLAVGYERLGEIDRAAAAWENATNIAPTWVEPIFRRGEALASLGQFEEAKNLAFRALRLAPRSVVAVTSAVDILGTDLDALTADEEANLLSLVEHLQKSRPLEARTLPMYARLLVRAGKASAAAEQIQAAIDAAESLPQETLLELADVSQSEGLELEDSCYDAIARSYGTTAELLYAQAMNAHNRGNTRQGREMLTAAADAHGMALPWRLAIARYLDATNAADAGEAWAAAADAAPENSTVQQLVLKSNGAWRDKDLIKRAIARLKKSTGDQGIMWRVAQARLLLESDSSNKAAAEAAALITDILPAAVPQARTYMLLATAFERLGNIDAAINYSTKALGIDPTSNQLRLRIAGLVLENGDRTEARRYVDEVVAGGSATANEIAQAASVLTQVNEFDRARDLLVRAGFAETIDGQGSLLLAQLYRRDGLFADAEALAKRVLAADPSGEAVVFTAELLASRGQGDEALRVLERLEELSVEPASAERLLAEFYDRQGSADAAAEHYQRALTLTKGNPQVWRQYLSHLVRTDQALAAVALIEEAHRACPEDKAFSELASNASLLRRTAPKPDAAKLFLAALGPAEQSREAIAALDVIDRFGGGDPQHFSAQLERLTRQHPRFLPLKLYLARHYIAEGRSELAANIAVQAMNEFPNEMEPAWLSANIFSAMGRWSEAETAAKAWRSRDVGNAALADVTAATAQVELGRPEEALATFAPYFEESGRQSPGKRLVLVQARALAGVERGDAARALLAPHLDSDPDARLTWIRIATQELNSNDAVAWLEKVAGMIPEDAVNEHVALGTAWYQVAEASGNAAYVERAQTILAAAAQSGEDGRGALTLAIVADREQDYATAEANYRLAVEQNPGLGVAHNNLAMLLVTRGGDTADAIALAEQAIKCDPRNANFYDTLAQAYAAADEVDEAITALRTAMELEPTEQKWRERLLDIQERELSGEGS